MAVDVNNSGIVNQSANQPQEARKSDQEINFANLRKKTEALEAQLQEKEQMMQRQQQMLDQMQSRFQPPADEFDSLADDDFIDKAKLKRIREKDREAFLKEAEQVARQTYQKIDSENFANKLKFAYPDYEEVVNQSNAEKLQEKDPLFMKALAKVTDEFERREMAYLKMKELGKQQEAPKVKAQDVVEENRKIAANSYTPSGQGPMNNPYAFEFDVRSKEARTKAYERLKSAQKRVY
jgi:hypothetical protein